MIGLSTFGQRAVDAQPELTAALTDPRRTVRQGATNALRLIAPEALTNSPPPGTNRAFQTESSLSIERRAFAISE
jgi:hypothetical protein